jgi:hypothetical protein
MHGLIFQGGQINQKSPPELLVEELRNMLAILDNLLQIFENLKVILPLWKNGASPPVGLHLLRVQLLLCLHWWPDSCATTYAAVLTLSGGY